MGRLRKTLRGASRAVKRIGQIALPLVFPAIGTGGGLPPPLAEVLSMEEDPMGEEEPTEEEGGTPLPPQDEDSGVEMEEES